MALQAGIVGLPNVGKSTLFNAVSNSAKAQASNYRFCTIEPNVGLVDVPDVRMDKLAELVLPVRTVPTQIEIVDIAGLVKGASKGEGLGTKFLGNIKEVDAIIQVIRCFCRLFSGCGKTAGYHASKPQVPALESLFLPMSFFHRLQLPSS